jgi:hypothetical protein
VIATTTPEPAYRYRAQTDRSTATQHLGAAEKDAVCFCGVRLMAPGDTRKFAAKYPADERVYETSADLGAVTCRACQRTRAWENATGAARPAAAPRAATITEAEAAAMAGAAADRTADATARPSRRRGRRAVTGDPRADRAANAEAAGNAR